LWTGKETVMDNGTVRQFGSGATRDTAENKLDYDGFLCPAVLQRYAQYMHRHRKQSDGTLRDSDNWQKGIPMECYRKSLWRHFWDVWVHFRSDALCVPIDPDRQEALCGVLFNTMGLLHEDIKRVIKGDTDAKN